MTTSRTSLLSEVLDGGPIPPGKLEYFRSRLRNELHQLVLKEFVKREREGKLTKAGLSERIGKDAAQVTRWLGAPGNWTIDTLSDLCLAMGGEPEVRFSTFTDRIAAPLISTTSNTESIDLLGGTSRKYRHSTDIAAASQPARKAA